MRDLDRGGRAVAVLLAVACALVGGLRPGLASVPYLAPAFAALAFAAGGWLPRLAGLIAVLALSAAMQADLGTENLPNVEIGLITLLPWAAGVVFRDRRSLIRDLAARRTELERAEDDYVRLAVRRERAAIARELHDIVSHNLAVIAVQAGAGRLGTADPPGVRAQRLGAIRDAGEQALTEMSLLVDVLRAERDDGFADLPALLARAASGGLEVHLAPLPSRLDMSAGAEAAAVAVVHEALTNAMKHAPGTRVDVAVASDAGALTVEVRDGGHAGAAPLARSGSGLGIPGMRERVEALGGTIEAGPHGAGWRVRAVIPPGGGPPTG